MKDQTHVALNLDPNFNKFVNASDVICETLTGDDRIPNNQKLPLLVYPKAFSVLNNDPISTCESLFIANSWQGCWRNGIFSHHHYHSMAHEVLGVCMGTAKVQFGGRRGIIFSVSPGDVVIIPAGVGHKNLGASSDLCVVGAYPPNQLPDLCDDKATSNPDDKLKVIRNIQRVSLPSTDPVYGTDGPLLKYWRY